MNLVAVTVRVGSTTVAIASIAAFRRGSDVEMDSQSIAVVGRAAEDDGSPERIPVILGWLVSTFHLE